MITWEQHMRDQDVPEECPICSKPSHVSPKVAPFCCTFHRRDYVNYQNKLAEEQCVALCAEVGENAENEGLVCRIVRVSTEAKKRRKQGEQYNTVWTTVCGAHPEYPKSTKALLTCFGCLSEGS